MLARQSFAVLLGTGLLACVGVMAQGGGDAEAAPPAAPRRARLPNPVFKTVEDEAGLPRVLLIGDSISMGYTVATRDLLKGKANVHRIPVNGGHTKRGLDSMDKWLGEGPWDVIHFNWGLHDLRRMPDGALQVPLEQYKKNLETLVARLQQTGAVLIWASTTPVPDGELKPPRHNEDVQAYNRVAEEVMAAHGIAVNDLYAFSAPRLAELQLPANVHFRPEGSAKLAEVVAACIEKALAGK